MEIDVREIWHAPVRRMFASEFELGDNAARDTWSTCLAWAERHPLVTNKTRSAVRDHFAACGAWDREEIDAWTDKELSALIWQEAAADFRHFVEECKGDFDAYEADCEVGQISGRLFLGEHTATIYLGF